MAVKLRLSRGGAKKKPFYRIVAANEDARRDGRFLDQVGVYDPTTRPVTIRLKPERVRHWLGVGAKPTNTVGTIIKHYLPVAEDKVKSLGLDGGSAVWVQGPDNSPAAQGVKGGPAENATRPAPKVATRRPAAPPAAAPRAAAAPTEVPVEDAPAASAEETAPPTE